MKRTTVLAIFIVSVLFFGVVDAQEIMPCAGVGTINIDNDVPVSQQPTIIRRALINYDEARLGGGIYCLVFNITADPMPTVRLDSQVVMLNTENLLQGHGNHDIYIFGLKLSAEPAVTLPLLTITNNTTNRVIVTGLQMTNVKNGLKLQGSGPIEVRGSTITGAGGDSATRTGQCVDVLSDNARVISSAVSNCAEGIKIAASNVFLGAIDADHLTDMNDVHDNGVGIHLASGTGNRWPYNLVRRNGAVGAADSAANGISIGAGANNDIAKPLAVADTETGAVLRCQTDQSGVILKRELTFNIPDSGEMTIYLSDRERYKQAIEYVAACSVDETGLCVLENTLLAFSQNTCGLSDTFITALFTSDNSSMLLADSIDLGRTSTIISSPTTLPVEISGMTGGGDDGADTGAPEFENPLGGGGTSSVPVGTGERSAVGEPGGGGAKTIGAKMACNMISGGDVGNAAALFVCLLPFCVLLAARIRRRI